MYDVVYSIYFLQSRDLVASNTCVGDISLLRDNMSYELSIFGPEFHALIVFYLRFIDYVCCSRALARMFCAALDGYREEALSDHWPLMFAGELGSVDVKLMPKLSGSSRKGWQPSTPIRKHEFNRCFRSCAGQTTPDDVQCALKTAVQSIHASTMASRKLAAVKVPVELTDLRDQFRSRPEGSLRRELSHSWVRLHRKWVAHRYAVALDNLSLKGKASRDRCRRLPNVVSFGSGVSSLRAEWPKQFARKYESKCNRLNETVEKYRNRLADLEARGIKDKTIGHELKLDMTTILQA